MGTGLLVSMLGSDEQRLLLLNNLGIAKGARYENIISNVLKQSGFNLYYYERPTGLEIDFIVPINTNVVGIKVKSRKTQNLNL